ncbi:MAG: hypothetical protein HY301_00290 [Verrucomicrobia bacterium]|nr:hypothetical protein [Verrucomicrobiota bacterium]
MWTLFAALVLGWNLVVNAQGTVEFRVQLFGTNSVSNPLGEVSLFLDGDLLHGPLFIPSQLFVTIPSDVRINGLPLGNGTFSFTQGAGQAMFIAPWCSIDGCSESGVSFPIGAVLSTGQLAELQSGLWSLSMFLGVNQLAPGVYSGPVTGALVAVPEPSSIALASVGALFLFALGHFSFRNLGSRNFQFSMH